VRVTSGETDRRNGCNRALRVALYNLATSDEDDMRSMMRMLLRGDSPPPLNVLEK
jgi:hypothetical protein